MALKLRVISDHYKELGKQSSRLFGVTGGRIGRAADNDWVLPDPERYISSHHARVHFQAGKWLFEDTSTNGAYLNGADTPLSQSGPVQLHDGDRLRMGDYEMIVSIDERADFPADASGQMPAPKVTKSKGKHAEDELDEAIDIHELLSSTSTTHRALSTGSFEIRNAFGVGLSSAESRPVALDTSATDAFQDIPLHDEPPAPAPTAGDDWHLRTRRFDKPTLVKSKLPAKEGERSRTGEISGEAAAIEAFCRGAGIDPASLPADTANTVLSLAGQIMRETVLGLTESLKHRSEGVKSRDVGQHPMQANDNNPLKIANGVDDAIRKMLDMHNTRYMGPVEAIRDAFSDIRVHQQATTSAMHAGLNGLLQRIDPAELQDKFDRNLKRGALMGATNKMKYWDMYSEFFQVLNQRNGDGLPLSFAEDFTQTYAERSAGFKAQKRK